MEPEHIQLLRDPAIPPTSEVLAQALGIANTAFNVFISALLNHQIDLKWNYYPDGKAWLAKGIYQWLGGRGGKKQMTVFWLAIYSGLFRVTIYFPEKARVDLQKFSFDKEVIKMINSTPQMGKLKFFPISFNLESDEKFATIFSLIESKINMK